METIRFYREQAGVTQDELAKHLGYHRTWLGKLERGEVPVRPAIIAQIAAYLKVPKGKFFEPLPIEEPVHA